MKVTSHRWLSVLAGVAAFLIAFFFLMPWGCAEVGGVSSWERCTSAMGTPTFSVEDWGWTLIDEDSPLAWGGNVLRVGERLVMTADRALYVSPPNWQPTGDTIDQDTWGD